MMSKKDYEAIAAVLGEAADMSEVISGLADYFKTDNPRFDRVRFITRVEQINSEWRG